jgi:hypothetical protein
MAISRPKAAKALASIKARDEAMREGRHKNYNVASRRAARISGQNKRAIITGHAEGMLTPQRFRTIFDQTQEAWKQERDEALAIYRNIKGTDHDSGQSNPKKNVGRKLQKKRWDA